LASTSSHFCLPAVLRLHGSFDAHATVLAQVRDAVGDPVHVLLDGDDHVAQDRRAAGSLAGEP